MKCSTSFTFKIVSLVSHSKYIFKIVSLVSHSKFDPKNKNSNLTSFKGPLGFEKKILL